MPEEQEPSAEEASLEDDLGAVFDEVNQEPEPEPEKEPEPEPETAEEEQPEEPKAEEEAPEEPVVEEPAVEEPSEEVVAPASWTPDAKEKFSGLDPAIQKEVLKRENDFQKGLSKNADSAKKYEEFDKIISPYRAMIAAENSTPEQAVASLFNTAYLLRTGTDEQRKQLVLNLAQQYGVDISQQSTENEDEYVDPDIKALKDEISSLKQTTQSQIQTARQQQLMSYQQQIEAFAADPENKHFDKVKDTMSALLQGGLAKDLKEAYNKSLNLVDEVRDQVIADKVKEAEQTRMKKESQAAEKAKKAQGVQLENEEAGVVKSQDLSLEEELAQVYDKATQD